MELQKFHVESYENIERPKWNSINCSIFKWIHISKIFSSSYLHYLYKYLFKDWKKMSFPGLSSDTPLSKMFIRPNENHQLLGLLQRMCSNFLITYKVFVDVLSAEISNLPTSPSRVSFVVILNEKSPSCFIPKKSYNMTRVSFSTRDSAYSAQLVLKREYVTKHRIA